MRGCRLQERQKRLVRALDRRRLVAGFTQEPARTQHTLDALARVVVHARHLDVGQDRITITPAVRSGRPCIKGTRITVDDILEYLAGGMSEDEILADFEALARQDIRAALAFAAQRDRRW